MADTVQRFELYGIQPVYTLEDTVNPIGVKAL